MKIGRTALAQLDGLIRKAEPLEGHFFRSVAFRFFHPDDVISGEGTRLHGGRFAPVGIPAVYGSADEETAMREVAARKSALGGRRQIEIGEYPRMTYILSIATTRNLDLTAALNASLMSVIEKCLMPNSHEASQQIASLWIGARIESVIFPSATGFGKNVVVYPGNASPGSVVVLNREEVLSVLRLPRRGRRKPGAAV